MIAVTSVQTTDLPALLDLLEQCGLPSDGLADHLHSALVARDGEGVVGSVALERYGTAGLLRSVVQQSIEFTSACPASALVMRAELTMPSAS